MIGLAASPAWNCSRAFDERAIVENCSKKKSATKAASPHPARGTQPV